AMPGRAAALPGDPAGCSQANTPAPTRLTAAGMSNATDQRRSVSVSAPQASRQIWATATATAAPPAHTATHHQATACDDHPPPTDLAVTLSTMARNPTDAAMCSQVSSRTLVPPSQKSLSASPSTREAAVVGLGLPGGASFLYGGRTAS